MTRVRVCAAAGLLLLAAFHALRLAATACAGAACDAYIPLSLLVPLLIEAAVIATAVVALRELRLAMLPRFVLGAAALAGIAGPPLALALLRDRPDALVATATLLFALLPLVAIGTSFTSVRR